MTREGSMGLWRRNARQLFEDSIKATVARSLNVSIIYESDDNNSWASPAAR